MRNKVSLTWGWAEGAIPIMASSSDGLMAHDWEEAFHWAEATSRLWCGTQTRMRIVKKGATKGQVQVKEPEVGDQSCRLVQLLDAYTWMLLLQGMIKNTVLSEIQTLKGLFLYV